jgi:hypothetical protein
MRRVEFDRDHGVDDRRFVDLEVWRERDREQFEFKLWRVNERQRGE